MTTTRAGIGLMVAALMVACLSAVAAEDKAKDGGDLNDNLAGRIAALDIATKRGRALVEKGAEINAQALIDIEEAFRDEYEKGNRPRVPVRPPRSQCWCRRPADFR